MASSTTALNDSTPTLISFTATTSTIPSPYKPLHFPIRISRTGEWKTNPAKFSHPHYHNQVEFRGLYFCGVYVNGIIYWLSKERQRQEAMVIIAFFVEEEVFRVFMLPKRIECTAPRCAPTMWESDEGRLMYGQICEREGLCIWVLHHPHELGHVSSDQYHHCDIAGCCSSADQYQNNGWKSILRVSRETLIAKLSTVIVINSFDQVERVSAFNEELYIVHIKTLKGYVSYNVPENTVSLLRDYCNKHDLTETSLRRPQLTTGDLKNIGFDSKVQFGFDIYSRCNSSKTIHK
ncbi:hypothetical protein H6P81_017536 [Aristolochia fimbriata]|uniref:F-box protein At3g26010-like beta-propeller domain-containing protein n=1 Tax=Aristolochia fimbriata TaxID=158543 RepID=A0AAV7DYV7_ARIFI|nr:hypothetical protein H6P81_017536 [Aristolochia fimbriata]